MSASVNHSDGREFTGGCFIGTVGSLEGSVSCAVGSIASQQFATITIVFTAMEGQNVIRSWTFAGLNNESKLANNTVETSFSVLPATAIPLASPMVLALVMVAFCVIATWRLAAG